jgi:hypothetical protein
MDDEERRAQSARDWRHHRQVKPTRKAAMPRLDFCIPEPCNKEISIFPAIRSRRQGDDGQRGGAPEHPLFGFDCIS